jgi:hypothetical protein
MLPLGIDPLILSARIQIYAQQVAASRSVARAFKCGASVSSLAWSVHYIALVKVDVLRTESVLRLASGSPKQKGLLV